MSAPRQDNAGRASGCCDNAQIVGAAHWVGGLVEVTWVRRAQPEQVHNLQPAKSPTGAECCAAAQRRVIYSLVSHAGVEQDLERAWKGRIPGPPEEIAIRAFDDGAIVSRWNGSELRFDWRLHLRKSSSFC
jgi:hypothetical protein